MLSLKILTLPTVGFVGAEESVSKISLVDDDNFYDGIEIEWDLAIIHERNSQLRQRTKVKELFATVQNFRSMWLAESRKFLAALPHTMRDEVIPLFEANTDGVSEDYQLQPSYSWLPVGVKAKNPDIDFVQLSGAEPGKHQNCLFVPLGRLFVNAENGNRFNEHVRENRSRLTRWTGYEVFIADDLGLWIAFDKQSLISPEPLWYPVDCSLTTNCERGLACIIPSISELEHTKFETVETLMKNTGRSGAVVINEVEINEVKKIEAEKVDAVEPPFPFAVKMVT